MNNIFLKIALAIFLIGIGPLSPLTAQESSKLPSFFQLESRGNLQKIQLAWGFAVEWSGSQITLQTTHQKPALRLDLQQRPPKESARAKLGEKIEEQDLGGSLKKRPPLARKNPKFRTVRFVGSENPLKAANLKPQKIIEETQGEFQIQTLLYPDGSKTIRKVSSEFSEESALNRKGKLVWRKQEGKVQDLHWAKTEWEDGSLIFELSRQEGVVSIVQDSSQSLWTYSFLNAQRELLQEIRCSKESCDLE